MDGYNVRMSFESACPTPSHQGYVDQYVKETNARYGASGLPKDTLFEDD